MELNNNIYQLAYNIYRQLVKILIKLKKNEIEI